MKFETFIAKRYLISKHKVNFITIISFLSIAGITIGVAALIVVLSVFNGFGSLVTSFLISFDPDVRIEIINPDLNFNIKDYQNKFSSVKEIRSYSPFVSGKVLAIRGRETQVINLKGITTGAGESIYDIKKNILFGKYDLSSLDGIPRVLIGLRLADRLESLIGDTLTLISPSGIENVITETSLPKMQNFIVGGIYSSNNNDYDGNYIFSSIEPAQKLLGYGGRIQGIDFRLKDPKEANNVKEKLAEFLNKEEFAIYTWFDFHRELYSVMQIERWTAYIILSLIIAVASFNILGSLSMSVIEKKRDIGILRSMGAEEKSIVKIFMFEGLLIGMVGTAAGSILGYFICFLQLKFKIYPLDPTQYKMDALPLMLQVSDFFYIAGVSMLLAFLAALIPAKRASKVNTIEAIKWE
ncbi:MAG: ABC transporter permease [Ignavibacteriaceae bacterium]|nr:ABC transporter permease [Ignavibacteriaceae bacterium]